MEVDVVEEVRLDGVDGGGGHGVRREADVLDLARGLELLGDGHAVLGPLELLLVVDAVEAEQVDVAARRLQRVEGALQRDAEVLAKRRGAFDTRKTPIEKCADDGWVDGLREKNLTLRIQD